MTATGSWSLAAQLSVTRVDVPAGGTSSSDPVVVTFSYADSPSAAPIHFERRWLALDNTGATLTLTSMQRVDSNGNNVGAVVDIDTLLGIWIVVNSPSSGEIRIGGAVGTQLIDAGAPLLGATDVAASKKFYCWLNTEGLTITAANDDLKLAAAAGTIDVSVVIWGTKA